MAEKIEYGTTTFPKDIVRFLSSSGGHSLIVRGMAGTGKTTLALQMIEELAQVQQSYYMSTRVSDQSLFHQFPWLLDKAREGEILQARKKIRKKAASEMAMAYDVFDKGLPERTLIVIDSIDALAEKYGLPPARLINALQRDLVEGCGTNIVYVLETPDPLLDYLGDGVLYLSLNSSTGRRIRGLDILKLRGGATRQRKRGTPR